MREILFRGKSIITDSPNTPGHWLEGNYISRVLDFEDGKTVIEHNIVERSSYINIYLDMCTEVWPETVGQWTGLLDKNGKKIFEGDILDTPRWIVSYCADTNAGLGMNAGWYIQRDNFTSWLELENSEWHVVLGNIHDNPELLKSST